MPRGVRAHVSHQTEVAKQQTRRRPTPVAAFAEGPLFPPAGSVQAEGPPAAAEQLPTEGIALHPRNREGGNAPRRAHKGGEEDTQQQWQQQTAVWR